MIFCHYSIYNSASEIRNDKNSLRQVRFLTPISLGTTTQLRSEFVSSELLVFETLAAVVPTTHWLKPQFLEDF